MRLAVHRLQILRSSWYTFARYHHRAQRFWTGHKNIMVGSPTTGEVRPLPESESILPLGKKPRLDGRKSQKIVSKRAKKRQQKETGLPEPCSADDVLWRDIIAVVGKDAVDKASEDEADFDSPFEYHQEVDLKRRPSPREPRKAIGRNSAKCWRKQARIPKLSAA